MTIVLEYRVHGANVSSASRKVTFEGRVMDAVVPSLDVELAWDDRHVRDHGSLTLRFVGQEIGEAQRAFVTDKRCRVTFEAIGDDDEGDVEEEPTLASYEPRVAAEQITDAERRIDPDPLHWADPTSAGAPVDDRRDTEAA